MQHYTILTASNAVHNLEYICLLTCTCKSISSKANVAHTVITSNCVFTSCIWITTVQTSFTLWNVCNKALKSHHRSKQCLCSRLPVQLNPSPSKPSIHVQLKLPSVSVQLALRLHGYVSSSHSLISVKINHE